jgi:hypothetical protein
MQISSTAAANYAGDVGGAAVTARQHQPVRHRTSLATPMSQLFQDRDYFPAPIDELIVSW